MTLFCILNLGDERLISEYLNTFHSTDKKIPRRTKTIAEMEWICEVGRVCRHHELKKKDLGRYVSGLSRYAHTARLKGHLLSLKNTVLSSGMWRRITWQKFVLSDKLSTWIFSGSTLSTQGMKAQSSTVTLANFYPTAQRHDPDGRNHQ
jgi:hypothetical protein